MKADHKHSTAFYSRERTKKHAFHSNPMRPDILLLDVDGVVTDRYARVSAPVVRELLRLARSGVKMAFVTGRSDEWLKENMAGVVRQQNPSLLFFCEFGSVIVGKPTKTRRMPKRYVKTAHGIARMFPAINYDHTKKTMISMEADMARPDAEVQLMAAKKMLSSMIKGDGRFRVLRSTYAVDVLRRDANKGRAARSALKIFGGKPGKRIIVIGDSAADLEMALPGCVFYFVGENAGLPKKNNFTFTVTRKKFSEGALAILKRLK